MAVNYTDDDLSDLIIEYWLEQGENAANACESEAKADLAIEEAQAIGADWANRSADEKYDFLVSRGWIE